MNAQGLLIDEFVADLPDELAERLKARGASPGTPELVIPYDGFALFPVASILALVFLSLIFAIATYTWFGFAGKWEGASRRTLGLIIRFCLVGFAAIAFLAWRRSRRSLHAKKLYRFGVFKLEAGFLVRSVAERASYIPFELVESVRLDQGRWSNDSGGCELDALIRYRLPAGRDPSEPASEGATPGETASGPELRVAGLIRVNSSRYFLDSEDKESCRRFFGGYFVENEYSRYELHAARELEARKPQAPLRVRTAPGASASDRKRMRRR